MKRLLTMLLCGLTLASSVYTYGLAKEVAASDTEAIASEMTENDSTTTSMEKAILAVKGKIAIPEAYSQFNYYFYDSSSYYDAYWSFIWRNPSDNSYIQVNCDADYHITYYYKYDRSREKSVIAKYLKEELKKTAENFIYQVAPELRNNIAFINADYQGLYSGNYIYNYQRMKNGVEFPDNTVSVGVSSVTGEVTLISINWLYDVAAPSSKATVSKEEAQKLIKENMQMKLVYESNYFGIYDKNGNRQTKAFLVYKPTLSYISVDAKTGKVYFNRSEWRTVNNEYGNGASKNDAADMSTELDGNAVTLTEEEIAKIEEMKKLITKDKAIDIVTSNPSLYLEDTLKSYTASLNKVDKGNGKTGYVWNIYLRDPREIDYNSKDNDYYRAYANATVDAQTGKILSFYSSMKGYYDTVSGKWKTVTIKYTKEEGRNILEKFLKEQIKSRFNSSVLASTNDDYVAYYDSKNAPVYGGYSYLYNRTNEGVEYPYNYINGCVDGVTGKIYSYSSYWDESVVFESTKGAMTAEEAMDCYLAKEGFGLKYEINEINTYDASYEKLDSYYDYSDAYSVQYEIRLVYRPDVSPEFISPFTGEQLNYNGEVYKITPPYTYSDIDDTPENRNILLLADMNIGFEGDKFLPDQAITVKEINELLADIGYGYYGSEETVGSNNPITREELAMTIIRSIGLEKLASLSGIYKTGYVDESSINSVYYGAVALAKGLGIMSGDSNNYFKPKDNVTRYEAVNMIINLLEVAKDGIYY